MNSGAMKNNNLMAVSADQAAQLLKCQPDELLYHAWPEVYGSTAGPFSGCGGQAITTFTMEAWFNEMTGEAIVFCGDKIITKSDSFKNNTTWKNWRKFNPGNQIIQ